MNSSMTSTNTTEEYLEEIFREQEEFGASTSVRLAKKFNITPQSVREKVKKLEKKGFVTIDKKEIKLSEDGRKKALDVLRKHGLAEIFLTQTLGLCWDEVDAEACLFEHILSDKVADALDKFLGYPKLCPHGYPIPDKHGEREEPKNYVKMSVLKSGDKAIVRRVDESSSQNLKYLFARGIIPGSAFFVEKVGPFHKNFLVNFNNACYSIDKEVADKIVVERV